MINKKKDPKKNENVLLISVFQGVFIHNLFKLTL